MAQSPFQSALDAVTQPLAFAARDDFAHADRVREFESSVDQTGRPMEPNNNNNNRNHPFWSYGSMKHAMTLFRFRHHPLLLLWNLICLFIKP